MPRNAKRTQPPQAPQDQGYGVRGEQIAAQHAMPLPDNHSPVETPMPAQAAPAQVAATPAVASPQDLLRLMQEQAPPPPGGLARATDRPDEPVTAGLGALAPATATPRQAKAADVLDQIASTTGDDRFAMLAQRARVT